jgi:hypothetical protein
MRVALVEFFKSCRVKECGFFKHAIEGLLLMRRIMELACAQFAWLARL